MKWKWLGYTIAALFILNWVAFVAVALWLGGSALTGKVEGGQLFVGQHGHYVQVTRSTYEFSRWHAYAFLAANPALLIALFAVEWMDKKSRNPK